MRPGPEAEPLSVVGRIDEIVGALEKAGVDVR
jgi:hypothetical protein